MSLTAGTRLGPYEVLSPLGRGGMGEVYRARHVKLGREVAIKILPPKFSADHDRLHRFEREARLASSLSHPNIITIYDIAEQDGTTFIAMELVNGKTLRQLTSDGPLPLASAVNLALQLAEGLARAHEAGVVHRDLKPENVMVLPDGRLKILDFGIAKHLSAVRALPEESTTLQTSRGSIVGTPRYMAPEQLQNGVVDHRSDQFAFGIVLYEMLAGKPPFDGPSLASVITAITHEPPPPLDAVRHDIPSSLAKVIRRCLAKAPDERFATTAELCEALAELRGRPPGLAAIVSPRVSASAAALLLVLLGGGWFFWSRGAERRWAEREAAPQIASLIDRGDIAQAYRLALRAERATPRDPELAKLVGRISFPLRVNTVPPGAEVAIRKYEADEDEEWDVLGTTPLEMRIPYALVRIRIRKEGFETFEGAPYGAGVLGQFMRGFELTPAGSAPPGTIRVAASRLRGGGWRLTLPGGAAAMTIDAFWLDRYEVTNRDFKRFVDAGGYRDGTTWPDGFGDSGTPWAEARKSFVDETGRPGPATWRIGTYATGADDLPVGGVSWYEAAAYCRWSGKTLPTIYHWLTAIGQEQFSDIQRLSNFSGKGPAPVGSYGAVSGHGAYDMAGNVKEWCWNRTSHGQRYALGGAWSDPSYFFRALQTVRPLDRLPTHGFRCAAYDQAPDPSLLAPTDPDTAIRRLPPISDEVFEAYRGLYSYDRTELRAQIESRDLSSPHWITERVSFDAAYGGERMSALIFLPRNAAPPYQVVVWFPGADADVFRTSETLASSYLFDFIPRSGRALVYPIYYGLYERHVPLEGTNAQRDRILFEAKDLGRTIDYLETRNDLDTSKLAYYGFSSGANQGPIFAVVEPRIRSLILLGGGLLGRAKRPETAPAHFASRCAVPALVINGVDDFLLPYEAQKALYDSLAAPPDEKRHARLPGGHIPSDHLALIREVLDWLDRWQEPVEALGESTLSSAAGR